MSLERHQSHDHEGDLRSARRAAPGWRTLGWWALEWRTPGWRTLGWWALEWRVLGWRTLEVRPRRCGRGVGWRDQALVELNLAVLHSFETAGVTITDHHTESRRFLTHLAREERAGRICPADWTWIVPPISGAATGVFHRYYADAELRPAYARHHRKLPSAPVPPGGETCS